MDLRGSSYSIRRMVSTFALPSLVLFTQVSVQVWRWMVSPILLFSSQLPRYGATPGNHPFPPRLLWLLKPPTSSPLSLRFELLDAIDGYMISESSPSAYLRLVHLLSMDPSIHPSSHSSSKFSYRQGIPLGSGMDIPSHCYDGWCCCWYGVLYSSVVVVTGRC
ncbi:MAG: hypothetical protein NXY57DRAFT_212872 [Lentinula lateritia]|nr:MAG: hypothetical protein NXY57DRAFT_212872 [Lentinula lateritia]